MSDDVEFFIGNDLSARADRFQTSYGHQAARIDPDAYGHGRAEDLLLGGYPRHSMVDHPPSPAASLKGDTEVVVVNLVASSWLLRHLNA